MSSFNVFKFNKNNIFTCSRKSNIYIPFSFIHKLSKIFPPVKDFSISGGSGSSLSISHRLMNDYGIVSTSNNGFNTLLPMGVRSIQKLINIVDYLMEKINGQKLNLPTLTSTSLWKKSGRLHSSGSEVMKMKDRHGSEFILSPTHEEFISNLINNFQNLSPPHLPTRLYQISSKFRDEMRLKHGLLRSREFLMKDLYTFDENVSKAEETYNDVVEIYMELFKILNIPVLKAQASVGSIGGIKSHEFHVPVNIGEDTLLKCEMCEFTINYEFLSESSEKICSNCKKPLKTIKGIEIAHAFLLGTKYSSPLSANYIDSLGKLHPLQMGCYGIGITRLLAAGIESLSKDNSLVWPDKISPYKVCIIPPKKGSKEAKDFHWCNYLYDTINNIEGFKDDVVIDDRIKLSIGKRLQQAEKFGYPFVVVIGKAAGNETPLFEIINNKTNEKQNMKQSDLLEYLKLFK